MNLIRSCGCGISTMHPIKNFHRNYHGSAFYLLMCFNTDFVYYKDGKIERVMKNVKPDTNAAEILEYLN